MQQITALDGLRAVAVLLVMAYHSKAPVSGGWLGVDVFFVLSGFLITAILRDEISKTGRINFTRFYTRRMRRLYPALIVLLLLYWAVNSWAWPTYRHHNRDILIAAAYLSDYSPQFKAFVKYIGHTWSLSVEMHFYLLWPVVILLTRRLNATNLILLFAGLFAVATAWRIYQADSAPWRAAYYAFDSRLSGLLIGAIVALVWRSYILPAANWMWSTSAIAILATAAGLCMWRDPLSLQLGPAVAEIGTAMLIICALQGIVSVRWLEIPVLQYLGKISYGLYLFHYPIFVWLRAEMAWLETLAIGGTATFALAALSYRFIETRYLSGRIHNNTDAVDVMVVCSTTGSARGVIERIQAPSKCRDSNGA